MRAGDIGDSKAIDMCRVSIIAPHTQIDIGLPAHVTLASYLPDVVKLVESRAPERSEFEPEPEDRTWHWTLTPIGGEPLSAASSISDSGVRDGDLLMLEKEDAPTPPALFDDVIDAVATLQEHEERSWSPRAARWTGYSLFLSLLTVFLCGMWFTRNEGMTPVFAFVGVVVGLGALVAGTIAGRTYGDSATAQVTGVSGVFLAAASAGLALPGDPGAPHLLLASALLAACAIPALRLVDTGDLLFIALLTAGLLGAVGAALALLTGLGDRQIGTIIAVCAFFVVSIGPRISIAAAGLPVPPVPTAGEPIDPGDDSSRPVISGVGAVGAMTLPAASKLSARAKRAGRYLSGITLGGATALLIACFLLLFSGGSPYRWQAVALAVILGIVTAARGRSHSDLLRAAVLVSTGGTIIGLVGVYLLTLDSAVHFGVGIAILLALAGIALWSGVVVPRTEHTPTSRRMLELGEYGLLIAIVPIVAWILGVYALVRGITL